MKVTTEGVERRFDVWFDYTKELMNEIKDGDLIAVETFYYDKKNPEAKKEAILRLSRLTPVHFAMPQDLSGYPAFVTESVKNASFDWDEQIDESIEDVTKIVGTAYLIGQNILKDPSNNLDVPEITSDFSFPMIGQSVKLLSLELTNYIYNLKLKHVEDTVPLGTMIKDSNIIIKLNTEDFIKTHFGIFGFTGAGKSNAIAQITRTLLKESKNNIIIILYDLLDEYLATLIDLLLDDEIDTYYVNIEVETLPDAVYRYINSNGAEENLLDEATEIFAKTLTIPSSMKDLRSLYYKPIKKLLQSRKIRVYAPEYFITAKSFWRKYGGDLKSSTMSPQNKELIDNIGKEFYELGDTYLNDSNIETLIKSIENAKGKTNSKPVHNRLDYLIRKLNTIQSNLQSPNQPNNSVRITPSDIAQIISQASVNKKLIIINSQKSDEIRDFAYELSMQLYEVRRVSGIIEPLCLSIFDEADEFIPSQIDSSSKELSTQALETLARRGRKYGLGLGIATQRIALLNTSIMAQPHTYLISKLPRVEDQRRITDAFALSNEIFSETVQFQKGQWLAISYDAMGLEGIPIPVQLNNNESSVIQYLRNVA